MALKYRPPRSVRSRPRRFEAVGVGDVGVEGGPDQVEPGAHAPGVGSAVGAAGGVTELMESGGEHRDPEHRQEQPRIGERLMSCRGQALVHRTQ